jgi:hypothetical protein
MIAYLLIVLALSYLPVLGDRQEHVFQQKGLMAGVATYGHLSVDLNMTQVDEQILVAYHLVEGVKALYERSNNTHFQRQVKVFHSGVKRRVRMMDREWQNMKKVFLSAKAEDEAEPSETTTQGKLQVPDRKRKRKKRFIATTIALISGLAATVSGIFSLSALTSISNSQDSGNTQHMIEVLQSHENRLSVLEHDVVRLNSTLKKTLVQLERTSKVTQLDSVMIYIDTYLTVLERQVDRMIDGMQGLLHHKITPSFLETSALYASLKRLGKRARIEGYIFPTETMVSAVFMLSTSFLVLDGGLLRIFMHIPLMKDGSVMTIYKLLPMPIPVNGTSAHLIIQEMPGYLVINEDQDGYSILPFDDLEECDLVADLYICQHHNVLMRNFGATCLGALWKEDGKVAAERCPYSLAPADYAVSQLTATTFAVYHPQKDRLRIECPNEKPAYKAFKGSQLIDLKPNCRGMNDHYAFTAEQFFGLNLTVELTSYDVDITALMGGEFEASTLERLLDGPRQPVSVRRLRDEFHFGVGLNNPLAGLFQGFRTFSSISSLVFWIIIMIVLIILLRKMWVCLGCACPQRTKRKPPVTTSSTSKHPAASNELRRDVMAAYQSSEERVSLTEQNR